MGQSLSKQFNESCRLQRQADVNKESCGSESCKPEVEVVPEVLRNVCLERARTGTTTSRVRLEHYVHFVVSLVLLLGMVQRVECHEGE